METFYKKLVYLTFLCAVFCFGWSTQDKLRVTAPLRVVGVMKQQSEKCGAETGVPAAHLKKIIEKSLPKDPANNQFFFCVISGSGLIEQDGHFNLDNMMALTVVDGTTEEYANTIKECNKLTKENPIETLLVTADCIHANYQFAPAKQ